MDIPLPDEIPLPGGGKPTDIQTGQPPPSGPLGLLPPPPRPPPLLLGAAFGGPPLPSAPMPIRPPMFSVPPPFFRPPPIQRGMLPPRPLFPMRPPARFTTNTSERYSPSRVTGDDDERDVTSTNSTSQLDPASSASSSVPCPISPPAFTAISSSAPGCDVLTRSSVASLSSASVSLTAASVTSSDVSTSVSSLLAKIRTTTTVSSSSEPTVTSSSDSSHIASGIATTVATSSSSLTLSVSAPDVIMSSSSLSSSCTAAIPASVTPLPTTSDVTPTSVISTTAASDVVTSPVVSPTAVGDVLTPSTISSSDVLITSPSTTSVSGVGNTASSVVSSPSVKVPACSEVISSSVSSVTSLPSPTTLPSAAITLPSSTPTSDITIDAPLPSSSLTATPVTSASLLTTTTTVVSTTVTYTAGTHDSTGSTKQTGLKPNMPKLLGKQEAKKRLMSFSGKGISSFSLAKTVKPSSKSALGEEDEIGEKKDKIKKKKKEEKVSIIEQIRNEESRLKEALGLKHMFFNPYAPGLGPIAKLLDNPEELKRFEDKGKSVKVKLEEYEAKQLDSKFKDKDLIWKKEIEDLENDTEKNNQEENKDGVDTSKEELQTQSKLEGKQEEKISANEKHEVKRRPRYIPKNWKDFKEDKFDIDLIRVIRRELLRKRSRSRSHERDRRRRSRSTSRDRGRGLTYDEPRLMYSLRIKSPKLKGLDKEYPGQLIQFTKTKPSLSYSINPYLYRSHFFTRLEVRRRESSETWEFLEKFWAAKPQYPSEPTESDEIVSRSWCTLEWNEPFSEAMKCRWDSDNEDGGVEEEGQSGNMDKEEIDAENDTVDTAYKSEPTPALSKKESSVSPQNSLYAENNKSLEPSGKLNEEYEAFLQMLDGTVDGKKESRYDDDLTERCRLFEMELKDADAVDEEEKVLSDKDIDFDPEDPTYECETSPRLLKGKRLSKDEDIDKEERTGKSESRKEENVAIECGIEGDLANQKTNEVMMIDEEKLKEKAEKKKQKKMLKKAKKKERKAKKKAKKKKKEMKRTEKKRKKALKTKKKKSKKQKDDNKIEGDNDAIELDESEGKRRDDSPEKRNERKDADSPEQRMDEKRRSESFEQRGNERRRDSSLDRKLDERRRDSTPECRFDERRRDGSLERRVDERKTDSSLERRLDERRRDSSLERRIDERRKDGSLERRIVERRKDSSLERRIDERRRDDSLERRLDDRRRDGSQERRADVKEAFWERGRERDERFGRPRYDRRETVEGWRDWGSEKFPPDRRQRIKGNFDNKREMYFERREMHFERGNERRESFFEKGPEKFSKRRFDRKESFDNRREIMVERSDSDLREQEIKEFFEEKKAAKRQKRKFELEGKIWERKDKVEEDADNKRHELEYEKEIERGVDDEKGNFCVVELTNKQSEKDDIEILNKTEATKIESEESDVTNDGDIEDYTFLDKNDNQDDHERESSPRRPADLVLLSGDDEAKPRKEKGKWNDKELSSTSSHSWKSGKSLTIDLSPSCTSKDADSDSDSVHLVTSDTLACFDLSPASSPKREQEMVKGSKGRASSKNEEEDISSESEKVKMGNLFEHKASHSSGEEEEDKRAQQESERYSPSNMSMSPSPTRSASPPSTLSSSSKSTPLQIPLPPTTMKSIPVPPLPGALLRETLPIPSILNLNRVPSVHPSGIPLPSVSSPADKSKISLEHSLDESSPSKHTSSSSPSVKEDSRKSTSNIKIAVTSPLVETSLKPLPSFVPISSPSLRADSPVSSASPRSDVLSPVSPASPVRSPPTGTLVDLLKLSSATKDTSVLQRPLVTSVQTPLPIVRQISEVELDVVKSVKGSDSADSSDVDTVSVTTSDQVKTRWVEKSTDELQQTDAVKDESSMRMSRSVPITFKLGSSKQGSAKLLQKSSLLPVFIHEEEEEGLKRIRGVDDDDDDDASVAGKVEAPSILSEPRETPNLNIFKMNEPVLDVKPEEMIEVTPESTSVLQTSVKSPKRSRFSQKSSPSPDRSSLRGHSPEKSRSPKHIKSQVKSKSPQRSQSPKSRSPLRSKSPHRGKSPQRSRSPRKSRDSRSRSRSPKISGIHRSPDKKRKLSPEYKRQKTSKKSRELSPRRSSRSVHDKSPPVRQSVPRGGRDRRSPRRFQSPTPPPGREERIGPHFSSPDSRRSRSPEKIKITGQGPRTPDRPFKRSSASRSPELKNSRRLYSSPPGHKGRPEGRRSHSPEVKSPDARMPHHYSPSHRSPAWSPGRQRGRSPGWRSPPRKVAYSPGRDQRSPIRRWSPRRSSSRSPRRSPHRRSPRRSPLRRSPLPRSRSPGRVRSPGRSRSPGIRSPLRRSPLRRSPLRRSPIRRSPQRRSPLRRSPLRRSPPRRSRSPMSRSPLRGRSPIRSPLPSRRSPLHRSPLRRSPVHRSPMVRSPRRSSRSPHRSISPDFELRERVWNKWEWDREQDKGKEPEEPERWSKRPPSPKTKPPPEKYYAQKGKTAGHNEDPIKIDADSTISDSELSIKREPGKMTRDSSTSSSPRDSPRRPSLAERLQREHGLDVEDEDKKPIVQAPQSHVYTNWGYQAHPVQVRQFRGNEGVSGEGSSRVIQVGNMLQVLPQDPSTPATHTPMIVQTGNVIQDPSKPATHTPMIVQAGNVIQVVPAENMQMLGAEVVPGIPVSSGGVVGMGGMVQVVTGGVVDMSCSSPAPVPPPVPSTPTKTASPKEVTSPKLTAKSPAASILPVPAPTSEPSPVKLPVVSSSTTVTPAVVATEVSSNSVSGQTQPVVSTHAAGLPVAHLISLLQQQQVASLNEVDPEAAAAAKEKAKEERRERKEKRRREREARREARQKERIEEQERTKKQETEQENQLSDTEDEAALFREAMYEVPVVESPVPDYEVVEDDDEDEDDENLQKKKKGPLPLPPADKGILMSPSYRYREYRPKTVKFADGILPGEGTSPSGGEEIHSPPPPASAIKTKGKKFRKKRKVKVRIIKQYNMNDEDEDSPPPPPPESPPPLAALKLYPGYTHYSYTAPGTVVIYTQQPHQAYTYASGQAQGAVAVPSGMVIQQGGSGQPQATISGLGGVSQGVLRYPGYVYTTVYSAGQQLQYVLPTPLTPQATVSPQKLNKK